MAEFVNESLSGATSGSEGSDPDPAEQRAKQISQDAELIAPILVNQLRLEKS